jgi:hypothetical protein
MLLNNTQLQEIKGGISFWGILGIFSGISFFIGLVDGFVRPIKCNG